MQSEPTPIEPPQHSDPRMRQLLELKSQMQQLHARLEYLRLMLKLGATAR